MRRYCLIQNTAAGIKVYTKTFKPGDTITVAFTPSADGRYTFTGVWGSLPTGTTDYLGRTEPGAEPVTGTPVVNETSDLQTEPTNSKSESTEKK